MSCCFRCRPAEIANKGQPAPQICWPCDRILISQARRMFCGFTLARRWGHSANSCRSQPLLSDAAAVHMFTSIGIEEQLVRTCGSRVNRRRIKSAFRIAERAAKSAAGLPFGTHPDRNRQRNCCTLPTMFPLMTISIPTIVAFLPSKDPKHNSRVDGNVSYRNCL